MSAKNYGKDTFFFIPHTHWEGAVFKTRAAYLEMGLPNILRAVKLLKQYPSYRFTLDQACYVQPFLERYPEEEAAFRKFVEEGRLAIVGGTDVMLDGNMPGGESFVRQFLYGKGYFRRKLNVDVTMGWQLDTFGHNAQMPQLLKLAGYKSFWFFRGVAAFDGSVPSEFLWEGLDGSRISAFWLPHAYANVELRGIGVSGIGGIGVSPRNRTLQTGMNQTGCRIWPDNYAWSFRVRSIMSPAG